MTSMLWLGTLLVLALAMQRPAAADEPSEPGPPAEPGQMERQLRAFLDGKLPPDKLRITYSDLHGLHGGLKLTIRGTGEVEQQAVAREAPEAQPLDPKAVRSLVEELIAQKAWQQKEPQAPAAPDESRATLSIVAGEATSRIWERYNELKKNDRMIRVRQRIQELAWPGAKPD